jgi:hypothetical protein
MHNSDNTVNVDLTDEEWHSIVEVYIQRRWYPATAELMEERLDAGDSIEDIVYDLIRNDAANYAIEQALNLEKQMSHIPNKKAMIWVTFQKEGIHMYPAAATDPALATGGWDDVSFLGVPHRHIFHFRVAIAVRHDDRDIEFIQFKRWLERLYSEGTLELNHKSCEMISDDLYLQISAKYPNRKVVIEVSEDGENGSVTEYQPEFEY